MRKGALVTKLVSHGAVSGASKAGLSCSSLHMPPFSSVCDMAMSMARAWVRWLHSQAICYDSECQPNSNLLLASRQVSHLVWKNPP